MVVTPSLVLREREASPLKAQMPRNSATELSTTSFFLFILAHKGDIMGVNVQLEQSKHFHFHLNYENGKEKRSPLTTVTVTVLRYLLFMLYYCCVSIFVLLSFCLKLLKRKIFQQR